eukprot:Gb_00433 [translate_table: standard]
MPQRSRLEECVHSSKVNNSLQDIVDPQNLHATRAYDRTSPQVAPGMTFRNGHRQAHLRGLNSQEFIESHIHFTANIMENISNEAAKFKKNIPLEENMGDQIFCNG